MISLVIAIPSPPLNTTYLQTPLIFKHHLTSNINIPPSAPLFAFKTANRQWAPMKRSWFLERCNEIWAKEGLTSIKGHGF